MQIDCFLMNDVIDEVFKSVTTFFIDLNTQILGHDSFIPLIEVKPYPPLLPVYETESTQFIHSEFTGKVSIMGCQLVNALLHRVVIICLQHQPDHILAMGDQRLIGLNFVANKPGTHCLKAILEAGEQVEFDPKLLSNLVTGLLHGVFHLSKQQFWKSIVLFLNLLGLAVSPATHRPLGVHFLALLGEYRVVGLGQSLQNVIINKMPVHVSSMISRKTQCKEGWLQIPSHSKDSVDKISAICRSEPIAITGVHYFNGLFTLHQVNSGFSSMRSKVLCHPPAHNRPHFWKLCVSFGRSRLLCTGFRVVVINSQERTVLPSSFDHHPVDLCHDIPIVFMLKDSSFRSRGVGTFWSSPRKVRVGSINCLSCFAIDNGCSGNVHALYTLRNIVIRVEESTTGQ